MNFNAFITFLLLLGCRSNGLPIADEERELWERFVSEQAFSMPTTLPSRQPVAQRTLSPTVAPTLRTVEPPTLRPTMRPVVTPISVPTTLSPEPPRTTAPITVAPLPTPELTTPEPTLIAVTVPTIPPSILRTMSPTQSASDFPSDLPSILPSVLSPLQPTGVPSIASSSSSSSGECVLQVNGTCSVPTGPYAGQRCDDLGLTTIACTAPPTNITFKYTAQACSESSNMLGGSMSCVDGTTTATDEAYVVATGGKEGNTLYRGWVQEGQYLSLNTGTDGEQLPDVVRIKLFGSNETGDPTNLVQEIQFPTSCEIPLRLKDQIGALLLTDFSSPEQGDVSCFVPISTTVNIGVLEESGGTDASFTLLELLSNYAGLQNFSDLVAGVTLSPGESIDVELPSVLLDLTERRRYTGLIQVAATSNPSGLVCTGTSFNSFVAGTPVPPLPEDSTPSASPSSASSADNSNSECTVSAIILCDCISDEGNAIGPCDQIPDPRGKTCADDAPVTSLVFLYRGLDGGSESPQQVLIEVSSTTGITASQTVTLGGTVRVEGSFGGSLQISVSDAGTELDSFTIDTTCSSTNPTLVLTGPLGTLGALELVGFENALGDFSSLASIRLLYSIENVGNGDLVAESVVLESEFLPGSLQVIEEQVTVPRGDEVLVYSETSQINIGTKFADNVQFSFSMNVQANATRSGLGCTSVSEYTI